MTITYEVIPNEKADICRDLCNELMSFQKSQAHIKPELFNTMNYETRMVPSIESAIANHIVVAKDNQKVVGYAYSTISPKETYANDFATFFNMSSVSQNNVGCLSQFFIKEEYRQYGVGSTLFNRSIQWLEQFDDVEDYFIFVSNGNENALKFYQRKGFPLVMIYWRAL